MIAQNIPDAQLLALFRSGDRHAFELLYNRYWNVLYELASRILEHHEAAKDVVQEVFIAIFEQQGAHEITNVRAYIFQAVKYRCFMHLRSGKISARHIQRMNTVIASNLVDEELNANELQAILDKGIATLPEKCREVFYLSRFEFQSNKKIAERLNISTKTVEHQITKALKALRLSVGKFAVFLPALLFPLEK